MAELTALCDCSRYILIGLLCELIGLPMLLSLAIVFKVVAISGSQTPQLPVNDLSSATNPSISVNGLTNVGNDLCTRRLPSNQQVNIIKQLLNVSNSSYSRRICPYIATANASIRLRFLIEIFKNYYFGLNLICE